MLNVASRELATTAADMAADRKANDIVVLELGSVSSLADYFVVCSGRSHIQVDAICQRVDEGMQERFGLTPLSVEGLENGRWAVIDYGAVVVHVFQQSVREIYDLERLWSSAPRWNYTEGFDKQSAQA
ncbi:MAG TPA: ribosome silencing factor [Candidatus Limnocylindrales bacterium]|nr:ribosome silencing factor [Candidatus Limnocylindrales bacterium]